MLGVFYRLAFCLLLTIPSVWFFSRFGSRAAPIGVLVILPVWSRIFGPYLVELFPAAWGAARWLTYAPWQGKFYEFDGRQIRFHFIEGVAWAVYDDVRFVLQPAPAERELRALGRGYAAIPGMRCRGVDSAALMQLLDSRCALPGASRDLLRFRRWVEHDVLRAFKAAQS
ncbi:MAG TPA: hypothetical protein VIT92_14120 [Burkholderiaceae bacterium]